MPTNHPRIPVLRDEALERALADAERVLGPAPHATARVHELALRGAAAVVADADHRGAALRRLAELSMTPGTLFDPVRLASIDRDAWGVEPDGAGPP